MRALPIVVALALLAVAAPAGAATKRAGGPRVQAERADAPRIALPKRACVKAAAKRPARAGRRAAARHRAALRRRAAARRRAALRRCSAAAPRRVGEAGAGVLGAPGSFGAPAAFLTAPAPVPAPAGTAPVTAQPEPAPTPAPVLPPVYSNPYAVQVQGFEFGLQLSKATVSAGNVRVEFNLSRAEDPHNLWLVSEDGAGDPFFFDEQPSREVVAKTLPLTMGRWTLFCSLNGHEAAGMRATLTVG